MKKLKWILWIVCMLIAFWNLNAYRVGIADRNLIHQWETKDSPDGHYTLAIGNGPGNWVWIRLRRQGKSEVLADRWFKSTEPNWVFWDTDHVSYSRYDSTGPIYLPPNWLERWLAKLP